MINTDSKEKMGIRALLPYSSYLTLLLASVISRFGDSIDMIAYSYMVYKLTGSKLLMGTILAVNFIPNLLFTVFAGVIADNYSKKKIVILGDIGRGVMVGLTALLFALNKLEPWHLFVITFIVSTFESFVSPAKSSLLPLLLPKELYLSASSFNQSANSFAQLIGAGLAGFFLVTIGISGTIALDAITFFISAILISLIRYEESNNDKKLDLSIDEFKSNLKEGFSFIKKENVLFLSILLIAFVNFSFMPFNVLRVPYVEEILKSGPEGLSYLSISFMIGTLLGGLIITQIGSKFKKSFLVVFGVFNLGLCYGLFSLPGLIKFTNDYPIILISIISVPFGMFIPVITSPLAAYIMEKTPKELLGRVNAVSTMLCLCASPFGAFLTGIVSQYVSMIILFIIMGGAIMIASLSLLLNKDFKKS